MKKIRNISMALCMMLFLCMVLLPHSVKADQGGGLRVEIEYFDLDQAGARIYHNVFDPKDNLTESIYINGKCNASALPSEDLCSDWMDAVPISMAQITMVIALGKIFDQKMTESAAKAMIGAAASTFAGRELVKCIPIFGWGVSAAVAAGVTEAIGWTAAVDFAKAYQMNHKHENEAILYRSNEEQEEKTEEKIEEIVSNNIGKSMDDLKDAMKVAIKDCFAKIHSELKNSVDIHNPALIFELDFQNRFISVIDIAYKYGDICYDNLSDDEILEMLDSIRSEFNKISNIILNQYFAEGNTVETYPVPFQKIRDLHETLTELIDNCVRSIKGENKPSEENGTQKKDSDNESMSEEFNSLFEEDDE